MKWKLLKTEPMYKGFFKVDLCHLCHQAYEGGEIEIKRELFVRGDAVGVLLYDPEKDKVVLIEQFRVGAINEENPWMLEIVAGMVESEESVNDVAQRECKEEAGVDVHSFETIHNFYSRPGGCSDKIYTLCAIVNNDKAIGYIGVNHEV